MADLCSALHIRFRQSHYANYKSIIIRSILSNNSPTPSDAHSIKIARKIFAIPGIEKPVFSLKRAVKGGKKTKERRIIKTPKPGSFPHKVFIMPIPKAIIPNSQLIKFQTFRLLPFIVSELLFIVFLFCYSWLFLLRSSKDRRHHLIQNIFLNYAKYFVFQSYKQKIYLQKSSVAYEA